MRTLLFLHGAGGYDDDRALAEPLAAALNAELRYPHLPGPPYAADDMTHKAWAGTIDGHLDGLAPTDLLVAHSFGASVLLQILAAHGAPVPAATLLAMPDWSPRGWDVAEYAFTGPVPVTRLHLLHCRDDEIVQFDHHTRHAVTLPSAQFSAFPTGGHQFVGRIPDLAEAIARTATGPA